MENYYERYGFSRDIKEQKSFIFFKIKEAKTFCEKHEFTIKNLEYELQIAKKQRNKSLEKEITQAIEEENKKFVHYSDLLLKVKKADIFHGSESESLNKKEKISDMYFSCKLYDMLVDMKNEFDEIKTMSNLAERKEKSITLSKKFAEYMKMKVIFSDSLKRKKYDTDLELFLKHRSNGYSNSEARIIGQKQYIQTILGSNFNPNMSNQLGSKDKFNWKVELYEKPKKLFVGKSNYPGMPQNNQEIYAYSFGAFEFENSEGDFPELFFSNSSCEIVGVTKKSADGQEETHFLIAPTRFLGGIKKIEVKEEKGKVKTQDSLISRISKSARKILEKTFSDNLRPKRSRKKETFMRDLVFIPNKIVFSEEEKEFLANVYFSDYLIDNAIKNNAHYLGNYSCQNGKPTVSFDQPWMDEMTVKACVYAKKNEGTIHFNKGTKSKTEKISNIEELFDVLSIQQCVLVTQERKRNNRDLQKTILDK